MHKRFDIPGRTGIVVAALCVLTSATAPRASGTAGLVPADYLAFEVAADPQLSPDGSRVAFVLQTIDARRARRSSIWIVPADGSAPARELTPGAANASSPRWSPDGEGIAFVSTRARPGQDSADAPRAQVHLLRRDGGEAAPITALKDGVSAFEWAPGGDRLVCASRGQERPRTNRSDTRYYTNIFYKLDGSGWADGRRAHLWTVRISDGAARQVTSGDWDDSDPQWSPDGRAIAFVSDRRSAGEDWEGRHADVWVVLADGGNPTRVSDREEAGTAPRWSPDGKTLAYLGSLTEGDHPKIYLAPAAGGPSRLASKEMDLLGGRLSWPSPNALFFEAGTRGSVHLFRVDLPSGRVTQVTSGSRDIRNVDILPQAQRIVYRAADATHLEDVYAANLDGTGEKRLTSFNQKLWSARSLSPVERLTFKGADNWDIDGFLMKPAGWREGEKYPMVLKVHGGPNGMNGYDWDFDSQGFAGAGYAVLRINPRGSSGYGEAFQRAVANEWGGKAYVDLMNGVDAALRQYPWIDGSRMGVTGHSYGGFMTEWIVGQTPRFKGATALAGISNLVSVSGTRDAAYNHRRDFGGDIFDRFDAYWKTSPLKYAPQVRTPTLILHGEQDHRVPLEQGEQFFRALKRAGVPSGLVIFPRASHGFRTSAEPKQVVEILEWQIYWFDRYVRGNSGAVPPTDRP